MNNKYGKLTIIKQIKMYNSNRFVLCKCDCGNEEIVYIPTLNNSSACSKCKSKPVPKNDLTNQKFGMLTITKYLGKNDYVCKCDCGNEIIRRDKKILSGTTISCGCKRNVKHNSPHKDLTGLQFGKLFVKKYIGESKYLCECSCGATTIVRKYELEHNTDIDCGHCNKDNKVKQFLQDKFGITKFETITIGQYVSNLYLPKYNCAINYINSNNINENQRNKFIAFKENGIRLISLFDVDFCKNISLLFANILCDKTKLYARRCECKTIDKKQANDFCKQYHLQGGSGFSSIHYGLFYDDELISVMTFGNNRFKKHEKKDCYELYRYCVKTGYYIIGGANKLLQHFELDYHPNELMSYSNNDFFIGKIYPKLGFNFIKYDQPRYYWFLNGQELKREECQVKKLQIKYPDLYAESLLQTGGKENYIMTKLGATKITRTGNSIWGKIY